MDATYSDLIKAVDDMEKKLFPALGSYILCSLEEDNDGQIIIYTNLMLDDDGTTLIEFDPDK